MQEFVSRLTDETEMPSLALQTLWQVQADPSYDVHRQVDRPSWVVVRTLGGAGSLSARGNVYQLGAETLLLVELPSVRRYRCEQDAWHFWWAELSGPLPDTLPSYTVMTAPAQNGDDELLHQCFQYLRREDTADRRLAIASFQLVLHRWLAWQSRATSRAPHREALERVIDAMHEKLDQPLEVRQMARLAHLSERRFRQVFRDYTGSSPKTYYDNLRLALARDFLQQGLYTVAEVADRLGYSSPFHFSRVFSRRYGQPPSSILRRSQ